MKIVEWFERLIWGDYTGDPREWLIQQQVARGKERDYAEKLVDEYIEALRNCEDSDK